MQTKTVSRQELYELVWTRPLARLTRSYGISDVGLAKLCRRFEVPCPPRGYWAKLQNGKHPQRAPLLDADREVRIPLPPAEQPPRDESAGTVVDLRKRVPVVVSTTLDGAHELVQQAMGQFQKAEADENHILIAPSDATLRVAVSRGLLPRALLILDAVIRVMEGLGHRVVAGPLVNVNGITVGFEIIEALETIQTPIDAQDFSGRYEFGHSRFEKSLRPSTRLTLRICNAGSRGRRAWGDTKKLRLEDRVHGFVAGIFSLVAKTRRRQEERRVEEARHREEALRRQEAARIFEEKRRKQNEERARIDQLLDEVSAWSRACELRRFIEAVRIAFTDAGRKELSTEVGEWITWATDQADRLDPLRHSPPSVLDEDLG